ncbi:MAG: prolyl oligopeptidase family serine peptidase [Brasilonema octagenarum HA4186-MV1]|jgi:prolyl oligopeptidase|nr:prolyl oligopeptidase family serine peptidase [Brasilonema octagenarum HA4186-MV1]
MFKTAKLRREVLEFNLFGFQLLFKKILMRRAALFAIALLFTTHFTSACTESTAIMPTITYPETKRVNVVEKHFGQAITDPYRWLENDVRNDRSVAAWVESQNKVTHAYLNTLPGRDAFRKSLTSLFDYERVGIPHKHGDQYFYTRKSGLENQPRLYVREGVNGKERVLIDPNRWSSDGADALDEWDSSKDGSHLAYAVQKGGSDWRTIKILDVATGQDLKDEVKWARFTGIAWVKDGSGFFYARYPEPKQGEEAQSSVTNHAIYFHKLGTPQSQDRLLYATPNQPNSLNSLKLTDDGRYAVVSSAENAAISAVTIVDLTSSNWKSRKLVENSNNTWAVLANVGTKLFFFTNKDAERAKIVTVDLAAADPVFTDFLPEQEAILNDGKLIGGRLFLSYLVDVKTEVRRYKLDGTPDGIMKLPGIGTVGELRGDPEASESFFVFSSFNTPGTVYRYDVATRKTDIWVKPKIQADLDRIVVDQTFYKSKDGTRIPMFVIRRKDVTEPAATILFGYGGYSFSILPEYSAALMAWVEQGGVVAIPNIRGGGEYGTAWHEAGRREKKQNVFDDFIAAAEYLKTNRIARDNGIAVYGDSNGGLLVGAVVNQRPDLFAAALPQVGVMDMLRFDQFTVGKVWVAEFGSPAREADFRNLFNYSPYHNIQSGKVYPAILATTGDTDDRVVPSHTFKYVAALQAAEIGDKPHLARIEARAGHGAGKPTDKIIEETTDMWAFAAHWTGLKVGNGK